MTFYAVGDPDVTPDYDDVKLYCSAVEPEWGYHCTMPKDHEPPHVAGDGDFIVKVWG